MNIQTYLVHGMTCAHCAGSVQSEVAAVAGVESATVDLATKTLAVTASTVLDDAAISAAVTEAGYVLAGRL